MQASWQSEIASAFRHPRDLLQFLELEGSDDVPEESGFPFLVSRAFADRMIKGDPLDPLLLQVISSRQEDIHHEGYTADPVGDLEASLTPGLLQKYKHRALVITTGACAIHCRYCFRRDFPYYEQQSSHSRWPSQLSRLREDATIEEVILSGGDPLMLSNERIANILADLETLPHIQRIRFHTRMPVVLPSRVDEELTIALQKSSRQMIMVIHSNHPNELDDAVEISLETLRRSGVTLLNQAVLLKGINDNLDTLIALSKRLHASHVLPYYLHALDHATGTAHFDVPLEKALELMDRLRNSLPGYLVPKFVQEIPGKSSKTPLF